MKSVSLMKILFLFGLGFIGISLSSFAQVAFGIKAGLNLNQIVVSDISSAGTEMSTGFYIGTYGQLTLTKKISFISELQYCQRGYKETGNYANETININYLEFPFLVSYSLNKFLGLDLGVDPSFEISTNSIVPYKAFDFGAIAGVRANITDRFFLTARYYSGFLSIADVQYNSSPNATQIAAFTEKTRVIQLGFGYKIK